MVIHHTCYISLKNVLQYEKQNKKAYALDCFSSGNDGVYIKDQSYSNPVLFVSNRCYMQNM